MTKQRFLIIVLLLTILLLVCSCKVLSSNFSSIDNVLLASGFKEKSEIDPTENLPESRSIETLSPPYVVELDGQDSAESEGISSNCMTYLESLLKEEYSEGNYEEDYSDEFENTSGDEKEYVLVTYKAVGDEIISPLYGRSVPTIFTKFQKDTKNHKRIWKIITDIIPLEQRKNLDQYILFTDGYCNVIGAVDDGSRPSKWSIQVDVLDSQNFATLSTTLVHELGHKVATNEVQIEQDALSCENSMNGCGNQDLYIATFYNDFWQDIYNERSSDNNQTEDDQVDEDEGKSFYEKHPDQFLSEYAATDSEEDFAESWTFFVFSTKPQNDSIAHKKILFFYQYPELVKLRQKMLNGLCQYTKK